MVPLSGKVYPLLGTRLGTGCPPQKRPTKPNRYWMTPNRAPHWNQQIWLNKSHLGGFSREAATFIKFPPQAIYCFVLSLP